MDMDNYSEIINKENTISKKQKLVDETIDNKKLYKYQLVERMFDSLFNEINELKGILFEELSVTEKSKEKAEKISKIAFTLQTCLDENGKEISENLNYLYRFIRYMSKRIQDNDDMNYVQPAFKVAKDLKDAWEAIPQKLR